MPCTASNTLSVPDACFRDVITALPPERETVSKIRLSSVATHTSSKAPERTTLLYTHMMSGVPLI
jgi:hypothetical protein